MEKKIDFFELFDNYYTYHLNKKRLNPNKNILFYNWDYLEFCLLELYKYNTDYIDDLYQVLLRFNYKNHIILPDLCYLKESERKKDLCNIDLLDLISDLSESKMDEFNPLLIDYLGGHYSNSKKQKIDILVHAIYLIIDGSFEDYVF